MIKDAYNVNSSIVPTTDKLFPKTPKKKQSKLKKEKSPTGPKKVTFLSNK